MVEMTGRTFFGLPDLRRRAPIRQGTGTGLHRGSKGLHDLYSRPVPFRHFTSLAGASVEADAPIPTSLRFNTDRIRLPSSFVLRICIICTNSFHAGQRWHHMGWLSIRV